MSWLQAFRRLVTRKDSATFRAAFADAMKLAAGPGYDELFLATQTRVLASNGGSEVLTARIHRF